MCKRGLNYVFSNLKRKIKRNKIYKTKEFEVFFYFKFKIYFYEINIPLQYNLMCEFFFSFNWKILVENTFFIFILKLLIWIKQIEYSLMYSGLYYVALNGKQTFIMTRFFQSNLKKNIKNFCTYARTSS